MPRVADLSVGEQDLDGRGEETCPPRPIGRLAQGAPDRRVRSRRVPLRESQQRPPRLRLQAEPARVPVRLFGLPELATQTLNLALEVARLGRGCLVHGLFEPSACALRLLQRVRPGALEAHQLRTVNQAAAGERQKVRLPLAPVGQCSRPLPGAAELVDLLARQDHAAVDDAGDDRRERFGRDRHHRLVQQAEPLPNAAVSDEDVALDVNGERKQVGIGEALADFGCRGGRGGCALPVAFRLVLEDDRHQHVPLLDALNLLPLEQPLCPAEPAGGRPHLSPQRELRADPKRATHCTPCLPGFGIGLAGPLQEPHPFVLAAEHVGGRCEQLEISGPQRRSLVGARQRLVRRRPGRARVRLAAPFELVADAGAAQGPANRNTRVRNRYPTSKRARRSGSSSKTSTRSTAAPLGPSRQSRTHDSTASASPSKTASRVPSARLRAQPATPRVAAARASAYRNPTPCTRPCTTTRRRSIAGGYETRATRAVATDQTAGTASCDQTVASSAGGGQAGSRVDVLATTQTSANEWPTTTASLRSNSPSADRKS